jgi:hypothetical protein
MNRLTVMAAALLLAAGYAGAQSMPPISRSKIVAQHAVNQTNAQTSAMTSVSDTVPGQQPTIAPMQVRSAEGRPAEQPPAAKRDVESSPGRIDAPRPNVPFEREVFYYDRSGRRDPFTSLMTSGELRPLLSDLKLVAVAFDATGRNSVAVLHDLNTKEQYRIRIGNTLGRMRVSAINPKSVTFTIEEFGFSRQENLALGDSNKGSSK